MLIEAKQRNPDAVKDVLNGSISLRPLEPEKEIEGKLPPGYFRNDGWICIKNDENRLVEICKDFEILGSAKRSDYMGWSLVVKLHTGRVMIVPYGDLHDERRLCKNFNESGCLIYTKARPLFTTLLTKISATVDAELLLLKRPGYECGHFALPSGKIVGPEPHKFFLEGSHDEDLWMLGEKEEWLHLFRSIWRDGNHLMRFAQLTAGGGILSSYLGLSNSIFSLAGTSSVGKTTALQIAANFNGLIDDVDRGTLHSLRGTDNGLEGVLESRSGVTTCLDEMRNFGGNPQTLVFMLAEGRGKLRSKVDGSNRDVRKFSLTTLISTERNISDLITDNGDDLLNGALVRCFDIEVSDADRVEDVTFVRISKGLREHAGHGAPLFAGHLLSIDRDDLHKRIESAAAAIADANGEVEHASMVKRAARHYAVLEVAGELMVDCGLLPEDGLGAKEVVCWALDRSIRDSSRQFGNPLETALDTLRFNVARKVDVEIAYVGKPAVECSREPTAWYDERYLYVRKATWRTGSEAPSRWGRS